MQKSRALGLSILLLIAIFLINPWQMVDPDALSHLAIGRLIVETGTVPKTDPFTFSAPETLWSNPEWLGDTIGYLVYRMFGSSGQQAYKLVLVGGGWLLTFLLAKRQGGSSWLIISLLLFLLPASLARFTLRNHLHAFWLIPLYGLILHRAVSTSRRQRLVWILLPLGLLWANLHGSFPLGWLIIVAALCRKVEARFLGDPPEDRVSLLRELFPLATILTFHPLLPLISPTHNYRQLLDHLFGASIYRQLILEWQPPGEAPALLAQLPFHLTGIVGLLSFLPNVNRRRLSAFLLFAGGLALGYSSQRFVPLFAILVIPELAVNLTRWAKDRPIRPQIWRYGQLALFVIAAAMLVPAFVAARTHPRKSVLERPPIRAARFLARRAKAGDRLFNPYNAGPWLLWEAGPRIPIYIDPRNNLGAPKLRYYVERVLPSPQEFESEARKLKISLAMVDLTDGRLSRLRNHLGRSSSWQMVFFDGTFAVYARGTIAELKRAGWSPFHLLRAELNFEYLSAQAKRALDPQIKYDRAILEQQGLALAKALEAYHLLSEDGAPPRIKGFFDPTRSARAAKFLSQALPQLPPSPQLMVYLATAFYRSGNTKGCRQVIAQAKQFFPRSPLVKRFEANLQY